MASASLANWRTTMLIEVLQAGVVVLGILAGCYVLAAR